MGGHNLFAFNYAGWLHHFFGCQRRCLINGSPTITIARVNRKK